MDPLELVNNYCKEYRDTFNPALMERDQYAIPNEVMKIIKCCERKVCFTLQIKSYYIIEDPIQIHKKLWEYEDGLNKDKNKKKKRDNPYDYIDMKDTDMSLLCVTYYAMVKNEESTFEVIIAYPKWVSKYYFKIAGNMYQPMYQIVDGSTYNNSNTSSKKHSVTLKTVFMPIRIYRNFKPLITIQKETVNTLVYTSRIFNKNVPAIKYILGKYGLYAGLDFMGINCITFSKFNPDNHETQEHMYHFKKNDIVINVPKMIFDKDHVVQSTVSTIYSSIHQDNLYEAMFNPDFWMASLGYDFGSSYSGDKGLSVCESLEGLYDASTRETIALPEEHKATIYHIMRWLVREFSGLKVKDNLDFTIKKLRDAEYIAALYAMRLSKSLHRIADNPKKTVDSLRKAIITHPMFLLNQITNCTLVNYRNAVSDMDSYPKVTLKGPSGLGDNDNSSIAQKHRMLDPTQLGIIDPDTSNNSDPGIGGMLCPMVKMYGKYFSDFEEPLTWEQDFEQLMRDYRSLIGMKEVIIAKKNILGQEDLEQEQIVDESIRIMKKLINPIRYIEDTTQFIEGSILSIEEE